MSGLWGLFATPVAALIAGLLSFASLIFFRKHRDKQGKALPPKIVFSMIQGAALYTFAVTFIVHWTGTHSLTEVITQGFGEDRYSYLLLGVIADIVGKMYALYDPD